MRVTPTWIGVDDVSHAVRTVVRLRRVHRGRERGSWRALCAVMALLAALALGASVRGSLPFALAWTAFAAALGFALLAAWHGFVAADAFAVEIRLADGTSLEAPAADARQLERLHAALAHALDWHGGTFAGAPPGPPGRPGWPEQGVPPAAPASAAPASAGVPARAPAGAATRVTDHGDSSSA